MKTLDNMLEHAEHLISKQVELERVNPWLVPYVIEGLERDQHCNATEDCANQYGCSCGCRACEAQPCVRCPLGWCYKDHHKRLKRSAKMRESCYLCGGQRYWLPSDGVYQTNHNRWCRLRTD